MADSSWDGKIKNLLISNQSNPELHSELSNMNGRARGERLRFLATLGLMSLKNPSGSYSSLRNEVESVPATAEPVTVEPVTVEPVTAEPVTVEPVTVEPVTAEPEVDQSSQDSENRKMLRSLAMKSFSPSD